MSGTRFNGAAMGDFLLYGLDLAGVVQGAERWGGITRDEAEEMARDKLRHYHVVEVWEGAIRVLRLVRQAQLPS